MAGVWWKQRAAGEAGERQLAFATSAFASPTRRHPMSRFEITTKSGDRFTYGFDRILSYYFLDKHMRKGFPKSLVGLMSNIYGSAHNLLEMCDRVGITLPRIHREELLLDLPLSEDNYSDEELAAAMGLTEGGE